MAAEPGMSVRAGPDISFVQTKPWRCIARGETAIWLRGYLEGGTAAELARRLTIPDADPLEAAASVLREASGHFAVVAKAHGWALAAVDWVRSIPLFYARRDGAWHIDDRGERLRRTVGLDLNDLDPDGALSIAMAGYTIDRGTLYRGLGALLAGECVLLRSGAEPLRQRYYAYRPWRVEMHGDLATRRRRLTGVTLDIIERMLNSLDGRTIVIPLSAGFDSRLIASAARHLGYKDVRCFAYGRAGNFEAAASRAIAERLGYRWTFVPATIATHRRFFASDEYRAYLEEADTCTAVPFVQDMEPLRHLKAAGYAPDDAVIVNGNSGDFISGGHIAKTLRVQADATLDAAGRKARIADALADKHFALWQHLRTPSNLERIRSLLWNAIEAAGGTVGDFAADHGLYECAEFQDRQSKYVIGGQRIYEFLGHDWRLPLWDNAYLRFWESVPLVDKANQILYRTMLEAENWGGAWERIPVNRKTVRPLWVAALRLAAKVVHAPAGRACWHRFESRFIQYWMDVACTSACVPYRRVASDHRGARHAVAWLAEEYLSRKSVSVDRLAV